MYMSDTKPAEVTEYLRPENTSTKRDYHLPHDCARILAKLAEHDVHPCIDIFPSGVCHVYLYSNHFEIALHRLLGQQLPTADVALVVLLRHFDFSSLL